MINTKRYTLSEALDDVLARIILNNPHEEFESFERLAHWFYVDFYVKEYSLPGCSLKKFTEMIFSHCEALQGFISDVERIYSDFTDYKHSVPVCGCILMDAGMNQCILVQGYNSKTWGFPKGKINKDERPVDCAVREVLEETGYDAAALANENHLISFRTKKHSVRLFVVVGVPVDYPFETQTRKEIRDIRWFPVVKLPTSYSKKSAPGMEKSRSFFGVVEVIPKLRQWVKRQKKARKKKKAKHKKERRPQETDGEFTMRQLEQWVDDEPEDVGVKLKLGTSTKGWNQFEANERLFGLKSDYSLDAYTTALPGASVEMPSAQMQRQAVKRSAEKVQQLQILKRSPQAPTRQVGAPKKVASKSRSSGGTPKRREVGTSSFKFDLDSVMDAFE